ncbi:Metallo-dependent phosphatase, partial [Saitoella complicata NRRL Y-17804]
VCISDTHSRVPPSNSIPDGDVFIHCGDLTAHGKLSEVEETFGWIEALPHPVKIVVAGNHDYPLDRKCHGANGHYRIIRAGTRWEEVEELVAGLKERGITYLCHESTTLHINGKPWNIFGSPRVPLFGSSAFAYPKSEPNPWTLVPTNTDILITHGPPHGHPKPKGRHGCPLLEREVLERVKPKLHCWGHIHDDYGVEVFEYGESGKGKGKSSKSPKKGVV